LAQEQLVRKSERGILLSTSPVTSFGRKLAIAVVTISVLLFCSAVPFARVQFPAMPAFVASYQSALAVVNLLTAVLLYSQFSVLRTRALLLLASGYLFTAVTAVLYALTFRDLFVPGDLFGSGPQTTAWLYILWHAGLPVLTLGYALLKGKDGGPESRGPARKAVIQSVLSVGIVVLVFLWIVTAGHDFLPTLLNEGRYKPTMVGLLSLVWSLTLAALVMLASRRPYSVLDVWLMVVMSAWLFDIALSAILNGGRFDFGYFSGRVYGLLAASFVLGVFVVENGIMQEQASRLLQTVRKQALSDMDSHRERQRLFSATVESSNDSIITKSLTGTITGWNKAAENLFGFTANEAIGNNIDIIVPDDRRLESREILQRMREGIAIGSHQTVRMAKNGRLIDVSLSVSPVKSQAGESIGAAEVARDITEQKLVEEQFELAVEANPSGIVMIDASGAITLVNAETERLFGYRRDELVGQLVDILVPEKQQDHHGGLRKRFSDQPATRRMGVGRDLYGKRKDGTEFPVEVGLNPIHTRKGILVLGVIVDITESQYAKKALLESEQLARGILDTALDGFVQMDEVGAITDWNHQAEKIFGWSREEVLGRSFVELIVPESHRGHDRESLTVYLRAGEESFSGNRFEILALSHDREEIIVELSVTAFRRPSGRIFNSFIRDLTEQRAVESQFRQVQKMEAFGQLTGGIAHDFNNILTVITGTIEILADAVADRPQLAAIARMIDEAAIRGAQVTQHLLAFARKQPLQPQEININSLVAEAAGLLRPTLGEHIEIESRFADDVASALIDPSQLTTAILNLALNARDAMPVGGKLTLETSNIYLSESYASTRGDLVAGDYIMIEVRDSGCGIPVKVIDRVFEPFFTTKDIGQGTGLGLSMVYGFVKQSNGHIQIHSEEGHGTTVRMCLPRALGLAQPLVEMSELLRVGGEGAIVLIVEDDALVRSFVVTQIQSLGYVTLVATNAEEALVIIDSVVEIDLLFSDVVMPGHMNGRQLADEALRRRPSLKILFTSAYSQDAIGHQGRLDGGVLLLAKPYRKSDLATMIEKALSP
jgi:PAS domain S-box-containing protein